MSHNHMSLDGEDRLEFLVPPKTTIANQLAATGQRFSRSERQPANAAPSLAVDRPKRPAATWGITGPELNRLANAVRLMVIDRNGRQQLGASLVQSLIGLPMRSASWNCTVITVSTASEVVL